MKNMLKGAENQTYAWSVLNTMFAWLGNQQNLMLISLGVGIATALLNLFLRIEERGAKKRERERKEEYHLAKMKLFESVAKKGDIAIKELLNDEENKKDE